MKSSVLKIASLVLILVLAFGCCFVSSVSATSLPTITIVGNNENPAVEGASTTIKLNANNLTDVKGLDLVITTNVDSVEFDSVDGDFYKSGVSKIALSGNNSSVSDKKIRIVSAFVINPVDSFSGTITLSGTNTCKAVLSIQAKFVKSDETLFQSTEYTCNNGDFIVGKTSSTTVAASAVQSSIAANEFVPYGAIYSGNSQNPVYAQKNGDGTFTLDNSKSYTLTAFKLPVNDGQVTTCASSKKSGSSASEVVYEQSNGIQFVSYALNRSKEHGTLVFKGDFNDFCETYSSKYYTKAQVISRFEQLLSKKSDGVWYEQSYSGGSKKIYVCRVPQTKIMWRATASDGAIQYAVRVYGVSSGEKFTAVGYTKSDDTYLYSDEYKTSTY